MAKITSKVIGVLYVVFGAAGLTLGDEADRYHNVLHLTTGILGVYVGFGASVAGARAYCLAFGTGYLAFGALGFVLGDRSLDYLLDVGLFSVGTFDHIHHMLLGTLILVGGTLPRPGIRRRARARSDGRRRQPGPSTDAHDPSRQQAAFASGDHDAPRRSAMRPGRPLPPAARLTVVSLAAAAAGVVLMMLSGVEFRTTIPPGLFILLVPAGLVALGRWRWTLLIATLAGLFIAISYVPSGSLARLLDPSRSGAFIGLWVQFVASLCAVVAGTFATVRGYLGPEPGA